MNKIISMQNSPKLVIFCTVILAKAELILCRCTGCTTCTDTDLKEVFSCTPFKWLGVQRCTKYLKCLFILAKGNQLSFFDSFNCVDAVAVASNNDLLSKSHSVTPQRHCGFFAPMFYAASQASKNSAKMTMAHLRPKSVYDWMTRPNKPMANKSGGSMRPRVNPVALISQFSATYNNSKLIGITQ